MAAALGGCDLAPHYHVPTVTVPVSYQEAAAWTRAEPADTAPRGDWWTVFGDPTLDRLENSLEGANPQIAGAIAVFDRARAVAEEAEAGLFPQLSVGGQITTNRQSARRPRRRPGQPNQYMDNVLDTAATYEFDVWDRIANSVRAGRAAAQATAADLATLQLSLHAELASDYFALRGLDATIDYLRRTVATFQQAADITQNRYAGKIASGIDVSRATNQLEAAKAELSDAQDRRALEMHAIAILEGVPPSELNLAPVTQLPEPPAMSAGLPATLLERRPDIASAERQMFAANAEIGVTRAAFYPNISLNAILGLQDTGFNLFTARDSFWTVGPGVALPLFEGGLRTAELQAAYAAWHYTVANYRGTVLDALGEVEDDLADLRWLGQEEQEQAKAAQAADQAMQMSMSLYQNGAVSYLEVVTAQTAALQAETAALDLRARRLEATVALIRALGGGWTRADLPKLTG